MKVLGVIAIAIAAPASAEVVGSSSNGFEVRHIVDVPGTRAQAIERFGRIGTWWNPSHSYSGKAENISLTLQAGSCFCETLPDGGSVEHLRVVYFEPGKRLTMTGGLGPLLFQATAGVMDVQFAPAGAATRVTMSYRVAGFASGGADKIAALVDQVLGEQMKRYAAIR